MLVVRTASAQAASVVGLEVSMNFIGILTVMHNVVFPRAYVRFVQSFSTGAAVHGREVSEFVDHSPANGLRDGPHVDDGGGGGRCGISNSEANRWALKMQVIERKGPPFHVRLATAKLGGVTVPSTTWSRTLGRRSSDHLHCQCHVAAKASASGGSRCVP